MPGQNDQLQEMAARLKAFGVMMRLGHDLFNAPDFQTAAVMAVNNARPVVGFRSSTLLQIRGRKVDILSQYAQPVVNKHSRQAVLQRELLETIGQQEEMVEISAENADQYGNGKAARELCPDNVTLLLIPLKAPPFLKQPAVQLVWLLEFDGKIPPYAMTAAKLLASGYAEALYCQLIDASRIRAFSRKRMINFKRIFWILVLAATIYVMFLPIPEKVNAEFELKAPEITTVYAWFDGPIAECHRPDGKLWKSGDVVKKGDIIARYDISQLEFRLKNAEAAITELQEELDQKERAPFDAERRDNRGEIKLLKARIASAQIAVKEAQWYLDHAKIIAPCDGILQLSDGRAEALIGKAVRTGDKIFEIMSGEGMEVKVPVLESESSILLENPPVITLFLHTSPDTPIVAEVKEISPAPELTEQRSYCYNLRAYLPKEQCEDLKLKYGMRGIAKVEGKEVAIGYFLFKSVILYFRGL